MKYKKLRDGKNYMEITLGHERKEEKNEFGEGGGGDY